MIKDLQIASKVICQRLRQRPYQKGVKVTAWNAVIEQLMDGRRSGAFSWHNAVAKEVKRCVSEMDEETKRKIWNASEDAAILRNADLDTITECLCPLVFQAVVPRLFRAARDREKRLESSEEN